jgi:hypothetical protein
LGYTGIIPDILDHVNKAGIIPDILDHVNKAVPCPLQ